MVSWPEGIEVVKLTRLVEPHDQVSYRQVSTLAKARALGRQSCLHLAVFSIRWAD